MAAEKAGSRFVAATVGDSDGELVRLCLAGDPAGFRGLYQRHVGRVRSALVRLVGPEALDDLTQDVFLRVWAALPTLREPAYLGTWVYRLTLNVATDALRRTKTRRARFSGEEPGESALAVNAETPRHLHERRVVQAALAALDFDHRAVLVLFDVEGVPQAEIAEILGIPAGTVKSRLFHARRKMRDLLSAEGVDP